MSGTRFKKIYLIVCASILTCIGLSLGFGILYLYNFAHTKNFIEVATELEIKPGANPKQISRKLEREGIISSADAFYYYFRFLAPSGTLPKAGFYEFSSAQTPAEILEIIQKGRVKETRVTIPEGSNKSQIAQILENAGLGTASQFLEAMSEQELIKSIEKEASSEGTLTQIEGGLEGYLFPDTYQFPKGAEPKQIIKRMTKRLFQVLNLEIKQKMSDQHLTFHEILTLASIIEKETSKELERPLVAGVLFNRLSLGMKLQMDPTVIYSIKDFNGNITKSDLAINNPYNTYVYAGLPPGPIASPGLASIQAVLWPAQTDFLYFVSRNDGTHEFCVNLTCHEKAVKFWQLSRKKPAIPLAQ